VNDAAAEDDLHPPGFKGTAPEPRATTRVWKQRRTAQKMSLLESRLHTVMKERSDVAVHPYHPQLNSVR